jgi:elongation factor Ts
MAITAQMVKELRDATGAAFLDCKNALEEYEGDVEKATAYLAEKGLATARKKADREANEGKIETYTHPGGRVGVMVEVNCETDFVADTDQFGNLVHELTLHIAFANPEYLTIEDVPEDVLEAKKAEYAQEAKADGKPENVIERIVEGRINKWLSEIVLM